VMTPTAEQGKEFAFSHADFQRVRALIYQRAGISLHEGKQAMVYSRVSRRLRATGHRSFASYLQWLDQEAQQPEWQEFINCLTTNLTSFFREDHHFELLKHDLQQWHARLGRTLRLWCCAASTGEEPYSIVMTAIESLGSPPAMTLLASDIDTKVLDRARAGVYPLESKGLSAERLKQHFLKGTGANEGQIRVKPALSKPITFRPFNLMSEHWQLGEPMDMVFCRNVMIYFDAPTQRKVLERLHGVMSPGGLLFVGHSENFNESRDLFRLRGKTVYERRP